MHIQELEVKQLHTVAEWLHGMNEQDKHYVAWLASDPNEIFEQIWTLTQFHEPLAFVAWEDEEIVGFIGILPFFEQKLCRLLGPYSLKKGTEVIEGLWDKASLTIQLHFDAVKVACFKANNDLVAFAGRHQFNLYNIEKTLALHHSRFSPSTKKEESIEEIQEHEHKELDELHPSGAYYTTNEMIDLSEKHTNKLWGYKSDGSLKGYLYFELVGTDEGEICFVNVHPSARDRGIGSALLEHALQYAFYVYKAEIVTISVRTNNEQAEKLYKNIGFAEINTIYAYEKEFGVDPSNTLLH
ncbi:N-acetyltransferase [Halobacillus sp. A5]|uniref:GNAT family N-acetyltransferase n=1 Tax=Halobacillus sp. A5 TaxID=2880263 RepID=UPI0020A65BA7|nr:N-acetyltransferase [Halobacillus sp. A5]MCP3027509.1 GNAT family N-acetyltransferase [Halobacillus sp. A5]